MSPCIEKIIWILIIIFLLSLIITLIVLNCNEHFKENFGSTCGDFIPFTIKPTYPIKKDTIFVSVASYRDDECKQTIIGMYKNAQVPQNVYVGICQQNKEKDEDCLKGVPPKYRKNIRSIDMKHIQAKGPTYARYWCTTLCQGEEYFLQIDSHTYFEKDWDTNLIQMWKQANQESPKPILSVYPATKDQIKLDGSPEMCNGKLSTDKIPVFLAGWTGKSSTPKRSPKPFAAGGFKFLKADFLNQVPYDPNLPHLFQGEETLLSARLWTHGYDFYTPNINVCSHNYGRPGKPKYWDDHKESASCRIKAEKRVLFLMGVLSADKVEYDFLRDIHTYGFGSYRKLEDFWKAAGIDFDKKNQQALEDWCNKDSGKYTDNPTFFGWNFKIDRYKKIKKFK